MCGSAATAAARRGRAGSHAPLLGGFRFGEGVVQPAPQHRHRGGPRPPGGDLTARSTSVGTAWIWNRRPSAGARSTSTLTSLITPVRSVASCSSAGLTMRHGPHQVAQKSTSTGIDARSATAAKSLSAASAIHGSECRQLPHRGTPSATDGTRLRLPQCGQVTTVLRATTSAVIPPFQDLVETTSSPPSPRSGGSSRRPAPRRAVAPWRPGPPRGRCTGAAAGPVRRVVSRPGDVDQRRPAACGSGRAPQPAAQVTDEWFRDALSLGR